MKSHWLDVHEFLKIFIPTALSYLLTTQIPSLYPSSCSLVSRPSYEDYFQKPGFLYVLICVSVKPWAIIFWKWSLHSSGNIRAVEISFNPSSFVFFHILNGVPRVLHLSSFWSVRCYKIDFRAFWVQKKKTIMPLNFYLLFIQHRMNQWFSRK
jgi:hypothetical protein